MVCKSPDYPAVPTHALITRLIKILQNVQSKALRFATSQRYPDTLNVKQINEATRTTPRSVRLHKTTTKIGRHWNRDNPVINQF